jgi:hypothetical protein
VPPEADNMNGIYQLGGKNWILPKEMNANRFFRDSRWLESGKTTYCMSLNGTEWRERGYGLRKIRDAAEE